MRLGRVNGPEDDEDEIEPDEYLDESEAKEDTDNERADHEGWPVI
jgi:hypothetical protein